MPDLTVAAGLARRLMEMAVARGASEAALAARSRIDPRDLRDHDLRIPLAKYVALMRAGKELAGDPALALHYGASVDMSEFSVVGLLFQACETIMEAIAQINRFGRLVIEVDVGAADRFQLQRRDGALWLVDTRRNPGDFPELTEATFARFISMTRRLGDVPLVNLVHVTHSAPAYRAEYDRVFQAPTVFESDWNAMRLEEAGLERRIAVQPRYAFAILGDHAEVLLRNLANSKSVRGRAESLLIPVLHTGEASIDAIARKMGFSRQTLYRRLKEEGVTFEKLLDELRHRLALHYLGGERVSVNETAYLVGFSDPAAFSRAFKRWTGASPRGMRSRHAVRGAATRSRRGGS
jgi:AraC-like DNA-binding protein